MGQSMLAGEISTTAGQEAARTALCSRPVQSTVPDPTLQRTLPQCAHHLTDCCASHDGHNGFYHAADLALREVAGWSCLPKKKLPLLPKQAARCRVKCIFCGFFLFSKRSSPVEPSCRLRPAGIWASPATSCAAPATSSGSSASPSCSQTAGSAASRRHRWRDASSTPAPSLRCVDENWGGSLKSKLLSGARSLRSSRVCRSSTLEAPILF